MNMLYLCSQSYVALLISTKFHRVVNQHKMTYLYLLFLTEKTIYFVKYQGQSCRELIVYYFKQGNVQIKNKLVCFGFSVFVTLMILT